MSTSSSQEKYDKIINNTTLMIDWLKSNISIVPLQFDLGPGERVTNSVKCINTVIQSLENYLEKKNFGAAFMSEYNLAYRIKKQIELLTKK